MAKQTPTGRSARSAGARAVRAPPRPAASPTDRSPRPEDPANRLVLSVHDAEVPEHLFRRLVGAYLGGAQQMVVREDPTLRPATRAVIRTFCRRTDRMEIERDDGASIVLQDQDEVGEALLGPRLRRMGEMVRAFHREAVGSWSRLPMGEESSWNHDDDALDREAWWLERHAALRLRDRPGETEALGAWTVARSLERIADHAVVLGEAGGRLASLHYDRRTLTTLEQFHRQAMEHLEGVLAATDDAGANDLLDMGEALMASGRALADRLLPAVNDGSMPPATAAAVTRILESITRTVAYAQDIAQVVLDRSVAVGPPRLAAPLLTAP